MSDEDYHRRHHHDREEEETRDQHPVRSRTMTTTSPSSRPKTTTALLELSNHQTNKTKKKKILYDDMGEPILVSDNDDDDDENTGVDDPTTAAPNTMMMTTTTTDYHEPPPSYNPSWLANRSSPPTSTTAATEKKNKARSVFRETTIDRRTKTPSYNEHTITRGRPGDDHVSSSLARRPVLTSITNHTRPASNCYYSSTTSSDDEEPSLLSSRDGGMHHTTTGTTTTSSSTAQERRSSWLYGEDLLVLQQPSQDTSFVVSTTTTARSVLSGVAAEETERRIDRPPLRVSFSTTVEQHNNTATRHGHAADDIEQGRGKDGVVHVRSEHEAGRCRDHVDSNQQQPQTSLSSWWSSHVCPTLRNASQFTVQEFQHWSHVAVHRVRGAVHYRRNDESDDEETDLLDHLSYLQRVHKEKVGRMKRVDYDDHYDFAIILHPQAVYAYWADLLDFRQEVLGEETLWEDDTTMLSSSQGTEESEKTNAGAVQDVDPVSSVIDARPFLTPSMGMRQRRKPTTETPRTTTTAAAAKRDEADGIFSGGILYDSGRPVARRTRTSIFQQAVGLRQSISGSKLEYDADDDDEDFHTPNPRTPLSPKTSTVTRRRWGTAAMSANRTPTPSRGGATEMPLSSSTAAMTRRRWGASQTPVRSASRRSLLSRGSSIRKKRRVTQVVLPPSSTQQESVSDDEIASGTNRRKHNPNSLRIEDIPTLVIPRGIVARTHGMMEFLSALKRGIVVRRHRPMNTAVFIMLFSLDGGDTIRYQVVEEEEARMQFHEQRFRHNRKIEECKRNDSDPVVPDEELPFLPLADAIAAMEHRQKKSKQEERKRILKEKEKKVPSKVADMAFKAANSGQIRVSDIIAVHPARHEDPRSSDGELGTFSLRRSKTSYHTPCTFSLVTRVERTFVAKTAKPFNTAGSEKWYSGEGKDAQFKSFDIETATDGEYWLAFRGFLLLHRDAASNRFAQQRNAGFGSNINAMMENQNTLHEDEFKEPPAVSLAEKCLVKLFGKDDAYMREHVMPDAVPPPSSDFLGFLSPGTQIWSRLRLALFQTQRIYGLDKTRVMIKVRCPSDRITDLAEVLRLKLMNRDGKLELFREDNIANFRPPNDELDSPSFLGEASLFRSSERQTIIDYIIRSRVDYSGAGLGQSTDPLGTMIQKRVPLHMHAKLDALFNAWFFFWRKENWVGRLSNTVSDVESQHPIDGSVPSAHPWEQESFISARQGNIPNGFYRLFVGSFNQPLDSIEQYFGEKVAFYFAWLQHFSFHLLFLSIAGLIVFICQIRSNNWDHPIRPYFATLVMLWSFVVLVNWRKRSNYLAYQWGTMDYKEQETTRPQFHGKPRYDAITGEEVLYYPSWKRWLKYAVSFPIILLFTFGSLILILFVHANRDLMLARYYEDIGTTGATTFEFTFSISSIGMQAPLDAVELNKEVFYDPTFWFIVAGLPALLGLFLPLLNFVLMRVSVSLNNFENYRTETEYRTHLIIKVFSFRFVCYFATLYYYSFISVGTTQAIENGILRVGTGVFVYITVVHWWGVFLQVFFPLLIYRLKVWSEKKQLHEELRQIELEESDLVAAEAESSREKDRDEFKKTEFENTRVHLVNKRLLLDQAQDDIWLETMLPMHDSFPEYIQAVVLFAYATCFSVVLPIAPLICLLNHLLSMRLDAYKLCRGRARTLAQKTGGIGVWEHVLHIVTVIAVLTNCWLMGFASAKFTELGQKIGNLALFCVVVGWEHVMLLIKYVMQTSISKLPKCIEDEMKREQHKETRRMNKAMRSKSGRRSQYGRDSRNSLCGQSRLSVTSKQSSVGEERRETCDGSKRDARRMLSEEESNASIAQCTSLGRGTEYPTIGMAVSTVCEESCGGDSSHVSTAKAPTPCRLEMDCEGSMSARMDQRVDSPFEMYVASKSFDSPSITEGRRQPESTGNISELLGSGLEEEGSLATNENEAPVAASRQDEENAAAAKRVQSRLRRLEQRLDGKAK